MPTTFTLSTSDFARLQKISSKRLSRKLGPLSFVFFLRVIVWFCIGIAGATYARLLRENPELSNQLYLAGVLLLVALLATVVVPHLSQALLRKHIVSPRGAFLSPQTIEVSDAYLLVTSSAGRTEMPWSAVLAKDEDDVNHYLFVDPLQAVVIPKSAVAGMPEALQRIRQIPNEA